MSGVHRLPEPPDERSSLPLLPATLPTFPLSPQPICLPPNRLPEAPPAGLPPPEDRLRSPLPAGLLGQLPSMARGASRLLETLPPGASPCGGAEPPAPATAGPKCRLVHLANNNL